MKKFLWKTNSKNLQRQEKDEKDFRIQQLEWELAQAKGDMRSITEEQETVNEELLSANEQLLSESEKLQSLNERMKSKKEELHSTNEELTVVQQEKLGLKKQLIATRDYAEAIVDAVHQPLVVLDGNLRVKFANKAFYKTFGVSEKDTEGKLIYRFGHNQWDISVLRSLLKNVLPNRSTFENFEVTWNFPDVGQRTMLLNAREIKRDDGEEQLILVALEDITERARLRQKEIHLLERYENLLMQAPVAIMVLKGPDYIVELANDAYLRIVEKEKDFIGGPIFESLPELEASGIGELLDNVMRSGVPYYGN